MSPRARAWEWLRPWAGLIGAAAGWALTHQLGSNIAFDHCGLVSPLLAIMIALLGIALAGAGGWISWRCRRSADGALDFVALVCALAALLFMAALIWQTAGALLIPRCAA